jgi:hypothetical protein
LNGSNINISTDNHGTETFNNLVVQTSNVLTLMDKASVAGTLTMDGGNIDATSDTLSVGTGSSSPGSIDRNSGTVIGNLQRWIDNTSNTYNYPVGISGEYHPMTVEANSLSSAGFATGSYIDIDPGDANLDNIYEDSLYMVNNYNEGYWSMTSQGMNSNDYNVTVDADGYNSVDDLGAGTRLVTRPAGATDWTLEGSHADATVPVIKRNNVSTPSAEFAVSDTMSCMPNTSEISGLDTVCANATGISYTVTDHSNSTFDWIIDGGLQASGSNTHSITVDWGSAGPGRVSVVEDNGCAIGDTVRMDVTINPYPDDPGVISPTNPTVDTIVEGNSKIYSIASVSNATFYNWNIPAALSGSSDSTEVTVTADMGSAGSDYQIEVFAMNSCGSSDNPSTKSIYIKEGLPEKASLPGGPTVLCQASGDTAYTTTSTARATSYEWDLLNAGSSTISGNDITGTLTLAESFNSTLGVRVRGVNTNGNGPWSDTLDVTVNTQPDGSISSVMDTICEGDSTQLEVNFSAGLSDYTLIYSDGTENDTIDPATSGDTFYPANHPQWKDGISDTTYYHISKIIDANGCPARNVDTTSVIILKRPDTGNQYYVPNDFDNN